jgi:hypothetical protein
MKRGLRSDDTPIVRKARHHALKVAHVTAPPMKKNGYRTSVG